MKDGQYFCENHPELMKLINLCDYSVLDVSLIALGTVFWIVVYVIIIRNSIKRQFVEMPVMAGLANIGWEFAWSFLITTDLGSIFVWGLRAWFLLDVFIFIQLMRYGGKQFGAAPLAQGHRWMSVFSLPCWVLAFYWFYQEGFDTTMGAGSAIFITVLMAGLYISLNLTRRTTRELSYTVAWCKGLGNAFMVTFILLHYEHSKLLALLGIVSIILDIVYIWIFAVRRKKELSNPQLDVIPDGHIGTPLPPAVVAALKAADIPVKPNVETTSGDA